jgi:hypothetical protein
MAMNIFHQDNKLIYWRWMLAVAIIAAMIAAMNRVSADDQSPASPEPVVIPKTAAESSSGGESKYDIFVTEALAGNTSSVATLRTAGLEVDDRQAMAILARVRGSGAGRNSAIAACFVGHREAWVQRTAIDTIAALGLDSHETLELVIKSLEDPSPMVAQAAAAALSQLRDPRSWSRLIELLAAKEPQSTRLAHESLQHQTSQSFPPDQAAWQTWLNQHVAEEEAEFSRYQSMLNDTTSGNNIVTAVDGLASLVLLRDQASAVLITLAHHSDSTVRAHVERHLRQWTGTPGGDSLDVTIDRAQSRAIAPPLLVPLATVTVAEVTPQLSVSVSVSAPGFFESTYGMLLIVTIGSATLATLLWFLRTPAGAAVQNATKRFTKKIANTRVAVTISNGTKRFAKKLPAPVKAITKRFTAPAKTLTNRLATETQRMLKPTEKPRH